MGNKEAKFKAIFEAIDTSGNKKVDEFELLNFLNPHQNPKVKEVFTELCKSLKLQTQSRSTRRECPEKRHVHMILFAS